MADDTPGLLERMVRIDTARKLYERAIKRNSKGYFPTATLGAAATYIALLEQEARLVGVLMPDDCTCEPANHARDDCPVHGMLPVVGE